MFDKKCLFSKSWECSGKKEERNYDKPTTNYWHWYWPEIYTCEVHKNCKFDWKDALNSRSNVSTNNVKMTHTKELSAPQALDMWLGNCDKIIFCSECKGIGGIADILSPVGFRPCEKCKCTGREINGK